MLKMGFVQDVEKIIESADPNRQLVMFSATTNQDVLTVSWKYQHDPIEIVVQAEAENKPNITQYIIESDQKQKYEHLLYLLDSDQYKRVMIFCNTKDMTARLCDRLKKAGYQAECLHGDVRQSFRDKVMSGFRKGEFEILVATLQRAALTWTMWRQCSTTTCRISRSFTSTESAARGAPSARA